MDRPNGEHWAGRMYLRAVSPYVTRVALRLGWSANAITWMMIAVGLAAAACFAAPSAWPLLGVVGIQLYLLLDCVDGEVARFTKTQSPVGVYLDRWGHYVVEGSMLRRSACGRPGATNLLRDRRAGGHDLRPAQQDGDRSGRLARLQSGRGLMPQAATTMQRSGLARGAVSPLPAVPSARRAVEASLVAAVAVVIDLVRDDLTASRITIVALTAIVMIVAPLHLVSILNSTRLTAE